MARYLIDTNVLLRMSNTADAEHGLATDAAAELASRGDTVAITSQVLIEFWAVATRPESSNGLGWEVSDVTRSI
jgi:predicted nucleic acid-binding protein